LFGVCIGGRGEKRELTAGKADQLPVGARGKGLHDQRCDHCVTKKRGCGFLEGDFEKGAGASFRIRRSSDERVEEEKGTL